MYRSQMSQAGLVVLIVMVLFCFPFFWIGLLIREEGWYCVRCGRRVY